MIEAGTHEELVDHGGLYAALWRVQTGEATDADALRLRRRALDQARLRPGRSATSGTGNDRIVGDATPFTVRWALVLPDGSLGAKPWRRVFSVLTRGSRNWRR